MEPIERITIDPNICHGRPTLRGLRYTVAMVPELLSAGMTVEEILGDYEDLEREDILAALAYAARLARHPAGVQACSPGRKPRVEDFL